MLRNSSAARKIGALREAVIVAFETALDQRSRKGRDSLPIRTISKSGCVS